MKLKYIISIIIIFLFFTVQIVNANIADNNIEMIIKKFVQLLTSNTTIESKENEVFIVFSDHVVFGK